MSKMLMATLLTAVTLAAPAAFEIADAPEAFVEFVDVAPTVSAAHNDAHNASTETGSTVYNWVPLIVMLFMVGIALAALGGVSWGRRNRG